MPLFKFILTCANETRATEQQKSSPQGWLLQAVEATFPEIASRRSNDILRLRLEKINGANQTWRAKLKDEPNDLIIQVTQA